MQRSNYYDNSENYSKYPSPASARSRARQTCSPCSGRQQEEPRFSGQPKYNYGPEIPLQSRPRLVPCLSRQQNRANEPPPYGERPVFVPCPGRQRSPLRMERKPAQSYKPPPPPQVTQDYEFYPPEDMADDYVQFLDQSLQGLSSSLKPALKKCACNKDSTTQVGKKKPMKCSSFTSGGQPSNQSLVESVLCYSEPEDDYEDALKAQHYYNTTPPSTPPPNLGPIPRFGREQSETDFGYYDEMDYEPQMYQDPYFQRIYSSTKDDHYFTSESGLSEYDSYGQEYFYNYPSPTGGQNYARMPYSPPDIEPPYYYDPAPPPDAYYSYPPQPTVEESGPYGGTYMCKTCAKPKLKYKPVSAPAKTKQKKGNVTSNVKRPLSGSTKRSPYGDPKKPSSSDLKMQLSVPSIADLKKLPTVDLKKLPIPNISATVLERFPSRRVLDSKSIQTLPPQVPCRTVSTQTGGHRKSGFFCCGPKGHGADSSKMKKRSVSRTCCSSPPQKEESRIEVAPVPSHHSRTSSMTIGGREQEISSTRPAPSRLPIPTVESTCSKHCSGVGGSSPKSGSRSSFLKCRSKKN